MFDGANSLNHLQLSELLTQTKSFVNILNGNNFPQLSDGISDLSPRNIGMMDGNKTPKDKQKNDESQSVPDLNFDNNPSEPFPKKEWSSDGKGNHDKIFLEIVTLFLHF